MHQTHEKGLAVPLRYCLYSRKSTDTEDKQVLSLESQENELMRLAETSNLNVVKTLKESKSAKDPGRPVFNEMIELFKSGKVDAILCWKIDRLTRNPVDGGQIQWLLQNNKIKCIRTFEKNFLPSDNVLLMSIEQGMANQYIRELSTNVKRGLRTRCELGWRPGVSPTGYLNEKHVDKKCQCRVDPKRGHVIKQMYEKVAHESWSGRKIYRWLKEIDFKTHRGKHLVLANVYLILRNSFYTGQFEFPVGSNQWYTGKHTPIIDKELFDKVQNALNENYIPKTESKEFAFTKLIKCAYCGSGITADEKFKKLKDGGTNRHVYYFCTRKGKDGCQNPYINESELINELIELMDKVDLDEIGIKTRIEDEIKRFNKFRSGVLGYKQDKSSPEVDVRNYTKYLLREGTLIEKRELLACMQSKLALKDKKIHLTIK